MHGIDHASAYFGSLGPLANGFLPSYSLYEHHLVARIALDLIALLFFLIFPARTRMALGRLEAHPGLAAVIGFGSWMALVPLLVLSAATIVLIPLIPVELIAFVVAAFIGTAALALLVGRRLYEMLSAHSTPSPLAALVLGLVLITAAELVPILGLFVIILVALVGLGSVALTFLMPLRAGYPFDDAPTNRPTISGPPMAAG